jgi:hypothetical protein
MDDTITYFMVDTGFFRSKQGRRLKQQLGYEGIVCLQKLWAYAAENKIDPGRAFTPDEVEIAAQWDGEVGMFCNTLNGLCFLRQTVDGYIIRRDLIK